MSLKDLLTRKKSKKNAQAERNTEDIYKSMEESVMGIDEMRDKIMSYIWYDRMEKLHDLCEDQVVMTPIFFEKLINEIQPGNKWNDVLFLTARKMLEAYPDLIIMIFKEQLMAKRHLVKHPDGGKEVMAPYVNIT